ncbi:hypothetical protein HMPREF9629_00823 [Peptoanaerobacter stomatis]|uniref:Lipoprotein n=1 Tax=Peptoanaerobacter stomatis TaxID=796937 RepID=G9XG42_9FIRM|nr:hypothetical protein [Peptoanaerobacter stomatis]EHL10608.1 hypothetical protein HMPREF9629_00823 [Peptoanaerobacter stomatis]EHL15156.1 hypothetical protein HMPREF9628_00807 [Peptoanaerobacter stomatis]
MFVKNISRYMKTGKVISYILLAAILTASLSCIIYANVYMQGSMKVNKENLPELDSMYNIETRELEKTSNYTEHIYESNMIKKFQNETGISLLYSKLASKNPYVIEKIKTDNKDYAILTLDNYITGDTSNYNYSKEEGFYSYKKGMEYHSPISLKIDIMLSENQMKNGWDIEYLGNYKFKEQYISGQGYKVNIIESMVKNNNIENYISEKCAVFVANGIRYTLKGRTSLENIKAIVDTMKYKN